MRTPRLIAGLIASLVCLATLSVSAPAQATENLTTTSEITAVTKKVSYGDGKLTLFGGVKGSDGNPVPRGTAALQEFTAAKPVWTTVATEAYPGGFAYYGVPILRNTRYRIVYEGYTATSPTENSYAPSESAPVAVRVSRAIKAKTFGRRLVGRVTPDYTNRKVKVLLKAGTKYVPFTKVRTDQDSTFRVKLPAGQPGARLRYRLYIPGNVNFAVTVEDHTLKY